MAGLGKLVEFWRCAFEVGADTRAALGIFWRETKNVRARFGLAHHHPDRVYSVRTRAGALWFRDNFGDITNLPNLFHRAVYRPPRAPGDGVILDVGANIGLAAAWFAREYPGRPIHCFEPLEENARLLRLNCPGAVVRTVAVGRAPGQVELSVDRDAVMASTIPWQRAVARRTLEVTTLDDYLETQHIGNVALLKVDTEGMELDVLDGAVRTLGRTGIVTMETHGHERHDGTLARLRTAGLTIDRAEFDGHTGVVFASRPAASSTGGSDPSGSAGAWNTGA
jgi:FkbM family methyltransferase